MEIFSKRNFTMKKPEGKRRMSRYASFASSVSAMSASGANLHGASFYSRTSTSSSLSSSRNFVPAKKPLYQRTIHASFMALVKLLRLSNPIFEYNLTDIESAVVMLADFIFMGLNAGFFAAMNLSRVGFIRFLPLVVAFVVGLVTLLGYTIFAVLKTRNRVRMVIFFSAMQITFWATALYSQPIPLVSYLSLPLLHIPSYLLYFEFRIWSVLALAAVVLINLTYFVLSMVFAEDRLLLRSEVMMLVGHQLFVNFGVFSLFFCLFFKKVSVGIELNKTVKMVLEAISTVDFSGTRVKSFLSKDEETLSTVEMILKKVALMMIELKKFLPKNLIERNVNKEFENIQTVGKAHHHHTRKFSLASTNSSGLGSPQSSSSQSSIIHEGLPKIKYGLDLKTGTLMLINIKRFGAEFEIIPLHLLEQFLEMFLTFVRKILIGWNMKNVVIDRERKAALTALNLLSKIEAFKEKFRRKVQGLGLGDSRMFIEKFELTISIVAGSFLCGHIGCDNFKDFNIFGPKMNDLFLINKHYGRLAGRSVVLVDRECAHGIRYFFKTLMIDDYSIEFFRDGIVEEEDGRVYEVAEMKKIDEGKEWMYTIGRENLEINRDGDLSEEAVYMRILFLFKKLNDMNSVIGSLEKVKTELNEMLILYKEKYPLADFFVEYHLRRLSQMHKPSKVERRSSKTRTYTVLKGGKIQ